MNKKWLSLCLAALLLLSLTGCGSGSDDTIEIGYIGSPGAPPQAVINQKYPIIADQLKSHGKEVKYICTRSLDNVWPLMDKEDAPEFFYIPASNFATYVTETSRFGGSDKYVIIAGSYSTTSASLIVKPTIKSLKDLGGKKVAIANNRYMDEFQFNELLKTVGLSTDSVGGTVQIVWADIVPKMVEEWGKGQYDAIIAYTRPSAIDALAKVKDSKLLTRVYPEDVFGEKPPRYWLIVRKDILKEDPALVKDFLIAHVMSTEKAIAEKKSLPPLNREIYLNLREEQGYNVEDLAKANPLSEFEKKLKEMEFSYDPNVKHATALFEFMSNKGLQKGSVDSFINIGPLNEALKEMGKPEVK